MFTNGYLLQLLLFVPKVGFADRFDNPWAYSMLYMNYIQLYTADTFLAAIVEM